MRNPHTLSWSELEGPYGASTDVPELLHRLKKKYTDEAAWELFHQITHQGTVYPVTAAALPFVLDRIRLTPHSVLLITVQVALAGSLHAEPSLRRSIRAAALDELPLLQDLCRHESFLTRRDSVPILAYLDPEGLAAQLQTEPHSQVRACGNLSLRKVERSALGGKTGSTRLERITAALCHPDTAPGILLDAIADSDPTLPDDWPMEVMLCYEAATALTRCADPEVFERLLQRFPTYDWTVSIEAAEALLSLAKRHAQLPRAAAVLNTTEAFWHPTMEQARSDLLKDYGLSGTVTL